MKFTNIRFIDPTNNGAINYTYNTDGAPTAMTSNEDEIWKVSASSVYNSDYQVWRAFNLNATPAFYYCSASESGTWVMWQNKQEQKTITSYSIVHQVDYRSSSPVMGDNYYLIEWVFEGSNDGSTWTEIDHQYGMSFASGERKTFTINNPQPYYYHRIRRISGNGNYFSPQAIIASTNILTERPTEVNDGLTPSTAWKNIPTYDNLVDDCLYIIRRTPRSEFCTLPNLPDSTSLSTMTNFAFIGCPKTQNEWFNLLSPELQTELINYGWMSDVYEYANIRQLGYNLTNMRLTACKNFYMRNINITRDTSPNRITSFENRWLFYFGTESFDNIDVQYCRFAGTGINLDDQTYINRYPSVCNGYLRADSGKNFIFNNNIVCYVNSNRSKNDYNTEYGIYLYGGRIRNLSFSRNQVYFTQENRFSVTSDYRYILYNNNRWSYYFRDKYFIIIGYENTGRNNVGPTENVVFNDNNFIFRACEYSDLGGLIWIRYFRRLEFKGNNVYSGTHMSSYDFKNTRKVFIHGRKLIMIGNKYGENGNQLDNPYEELIIKDLNINLPELWNVGSANCYSSTTDTNYDYYRRGAVVYISASLINYYRAMGGDDRSPYYVNNQTTRYSGTRTCTFKKEISNINITLGEGPEYSDSNTNKTFAINQLDLDITRGWALIIDGVRKYSSANNDTSRPTYIHDIVPFGFNVSNINVSAPWMIAIKAWCCCLKNNINIRGGVVTTVGYTDIDNLSLKYSKSMIGSMDYDTMIIKNLICENNAHENSIYSRVNGYGNYIVNKSNISTFSNGSYWGDAYNESYMCHKEIGTNKKFKYRTNAFFIESCNVKRNNLETLKIYGDSRFTASRPMKITGFGDDAISSRQLSAGRYKIVLHCGFTGTDLIAKTITSPTTDNYNVFISFIPILKTNNTVKFLTDYDVVDNYSWSLSSDFYAFDVHGYIDIYKRQKINLGLSYNVISANYLSDGSGSAVFVDPKFDCILVEEYEETSDSESQS